MSTSKSFQAQSLLLAPSAKTLIGSTL